MYSPKISCIIPTYNRSAFIKEAINSVIRQTFEDWELIIVDDGSLDNTEEVVKHFIKSESRISYYKNPRKGGSAARNFGIKQAFGEYIAFLDDDDISLPHRFESQLKAVKKSGSNFLVSGYQVRNRKSNDLILENKLELKGLGAGFPSRWLVKKDLLEQVRGFDVDFPSMQDIEISYRLSEYETFVMHDEIVSIIYPTENSISKRVENSIKGKIMLMERLGAKMHPVEAAWWYFVIGQDHYRLGNITDSFKNLKEAARLDERKIFTLGYFYSKIFFSLALIPSGINLKILNYISGFRFPEIVKHQVI